MAKRLLAAILAWLLAAPPFALAALSDNLISCWNFNESSGNPADSVGSNNLTNTSMTFTSGKLNNATNNDGSVAYHSIADNASLSLSADQDFTIAAWVNLTDKSVSRGIVAKDDTGSNREYNLYYAASPDRFQLIVWDASSLSSVNADTLGSPSTATWYLVIVKHDSAANQISIKVNNGTADTTAHSAGTRDQAAGFYVGAFSNGSSNMNGLIDVVAFWKRVTTGAEDTEIYNSGTGRECAYLAAAGGGAPAAARRRSGGSAFQ